MQLEAKNQKLVESNIALSAKSTMIKKEMELYKVNHNVIKNKAKKTDNLENQTLMKDNEELHQQNRFLTNELLLWRKYDYHVQKVIASLIKTQEFNVKSLELKLVEAEEKIMMLKKSYTKPIEDTYEHNKLRISYETMKSDIESLQELLNEQKVIFQCKMDEMVIFK